MGETSPSNSVGGAGSDPRVPRQLILSLGMSFLGNHLSLIPTNNLIVIVVYKISDYDEQ